MLPVRKGTRISQALRQPNKISHATLKKDEVKDETMTKQDGVSLVKEQVGNDSVNSTIGNADVQTEGADVTAENVVIPEGPDDAIDEFEAPKELPRKESRPPPPSCKRCFQKFAQRRSTVCSHQFCGQCWQKLEVLSTASDDPNNKPKGEYETITFICPLCSATDTYQRRKSSLEVGTAETLGKDVKKTSYIQLQRVAWNPYYPDAITHCDDGSFVMVSEQTQEIIILMPDGQIKRRFQYLNNHKFQGGLGAYKDGIVFVALKSEKFSGISYYSLEGKFRYSAFLYDESPELGTIPSLAIDVSFPGALVALDVEKQNLCSISKEKLVVSLPLTEHGNLVHGHHVKDQQLTKETKPEHSNTKHKEDCTEQGDGENLQQTGNRENGTETEAAKHGLEVEDNSEPKEAYGELRNGRVEQEVCDSILREDDTTALSVPATEAIRSDDLVGSAAKTPREEDSVEMNDGTEGSQVTPLAPLSVAAPPSFSAVAVNSWGQILLYDLANRCVRIFDRGDTINKEVAQMDLRQYLETTDVILGRVKILVDEHDNVIVLDTQKQRLLRFSTEGRYLDTLIEIPLTRIDGTVLKLVDVTCYPKGHLSILYTVYRDERHKEGLESTSSDASPRRAATYEISTYTYSTPRKYRHKERKDRIKLKGSDRRTDGIMTEKPKCCIIA